MVWGDTLSTWEARQCRTDVQHRMHALVMDTTSPCDFLIFFSCERKYQKRLLATTCAESH